MQRQFKVKDHRAGIYIPGAYQGTFSAEQAGRDQGAHFFHFAAAEQQMNYPEVHPLLTCGAGGTAAPTEKAGSQGGDFQAQLAVKWRHRTVKNDDV